MTDRMWVKIRSWHVFRTWTRAGQALTECGRRVGPDTVVTADELPGNEKSCESCLRIVTRAEDH